MSVSVSECVSVCECECECEYECECECECECVSVMAIAYYICPGSSGHEWHINILAEAVSNHIKELLGIAERKEAHILHSSTPLTYCSVILLLRLSSGQLQEPLHLPHGLQLLQSLPVPRLSLQHLGVVVSGQPGVAQHQVALGSSEVALAETRGKKGEAKNKVSGLAGHCRKLHGKWPVASRYFELWRG